MRALLPTAGHRRVGGFGAGCGRPERASSQSGARNILLAPPSYFKNVVMKGCFSGSHPYSTSLAIPAGTFWFTTFRPLQRWTFGRTHRPPAPRLSGRRHRRKGLLRRLALYERLLSEHRDLVILIGDERHLAQGVRLGGQARFPAAPTFCQQEFGALAVDGVDDNRIVDLVAELLKNPVTPAVKVLVSHVRGKQSGTRCALPGFHFR